MAALPEARLIVEAGPGSGKTRVAIERVRSLIDADVALTRIWMVSFTHAAMGRRGTGSPRRWRTRGPLLNSDLDSGLLAARLRRYGSSETSEQRP